MTKDQAKKGRLILDQINEHESLDAKIRSLHTKAEAGDGESIDKLASVCLELNGLVVRSLEDRLSRA